MYASVPRSSSVVWPAGICTAWTSRDSSIRSIGSSSAPALWCLARRLASCARLTDGARGPYGFCMPDRWDGGSPRRPPPDPLGQIIDLSERLRQRLGEAGQSGPRFNPLWLLGAVALLWLLSGIYIVAPDERGV